MRLQTVNARREFDQASEGRKVVARQRCTGQRIGGSLAKDGGQRRPLADSGPNYHATSRWRCPSSSRHARPKSKAAALLTDGGVEQRPLEHLDERGSGVDDLQGGRVCSSLGLNAGCANAGGQGA